MFISLAYVEARRDTLSTVTIFDDRDGRAWSEPPPPRSPPRRPARSAASPFVVPAGAREARGARGDADFPDFFDVDLVLGDAYALSVAPASPPPPPPPPPSAKSPVRAPTSRPTVLDAPKRPGTPKVETPPTRAARRAPPPRVPWKRPKLPRPSAAPGDPIWRKPPSSTPAALENLTGEVGGSDDAPDDAPDSRVGENRVSSGVVGGSAFPGCRGVPG